MAGNPVHLALPLEWADHWRLCLRTAVLALEEGVAVAEEEGAEAEEAGTEQRSLQLLEGCHHRHHRRTPQRLMPALLPQHI